MARNTAISTLQNLPTNIELLAAQRQLYSEAKRARGIRTVGAVISAVPLPILAAFVPASWSWVAGFGAFWLVVSLVALFGIEKRLTAQATRVLEQFDVSVFGLQWNQRLAGHKETAELIAAASSRFSGDRQALRDWYPIVADRLPGPLSVLLCQRTAVVWDCRLRRGFAWIVALSTSLLLIAAVVAALLLQYTAAQLMLVFVVPMMPAFVTGARSVLLHRDSAHDQKDMQARMDDDWHQALAQTDSLSLNECRQHQDCRFRLRLHSVPVPDAWYRLRRASFEMDARGAADRMVEEYESRDGLPPSPERH